MPKTKSKGARTVKKVIETLEADGYIVDKVERGGRFAKYKDLFAGYCLRCGGKGDECCDNPRRFAGFDLIAIHPYHPPILIQVKTNTPPVQKDYSKFAMKFAENHLVIESWTWYDRKGFVIHKYLKDGNIEKTDLRKR